MPEYTKEEALAFVEAMRLNLSGKVGFSWFVERLSQLSFYIKTIADENEQLNTYIDSVGARGNYQSYCAAQPDGGSPDEAQEEE